MKLKFNFLQLYMFGFSIWFIYAIMITIKESIEASASFWIVAILFAIAAEMRAAASRGEE